MAARYAATNVYLKWIANYSIISYSSIEECPVIEHGSREGMSFKIDEPEQLLVTPSYSRTNELYEIQDTYN